MEEAKEQHEKQKQESSTIISEQQLEELWSCDTPDLQVRYLCDWATVRQYDRNATSKAFVDFCFHLLMFAKQRAHMDAAKCATLLTCMNSVYNYATHEPWPSLDETYALFSTLVKQHSTQLDTFSIEDVRAIVDYTVATFFSQYKLIQYAAKHKPLQRMTRVPLVVETPLRPVPLCEAQQQQQNEQNDDHRSAHKIKTVEGDTGIISSSKTTTTTAAAATRVPETVK